jgi:phenylalanyl-tRNA synthetase beta chain
MHAHDSSKIHGDFAVRFAEPGERVRTLDGVDRPLEPGDVLIVDEVAVAAIGGVMGAGTTEIDANTTDVLLEAAVWDPATVSRTVRRLHLVSEAGRRYERWVDPAVSVAAASIVAAALVIVRRAAISAIVPRVVISAIVHRRGANSAAMKAARPMTSPARSSGLTKCAALAS